MLHTIPFLLFVSPIKSQCLFHLQTHSLVHPSKSPGSLTSHSTPFYLQALERGLGKGMVFVFPIIIFVPGFMVLQHS